MPDIKTALQEALSKTATAWAADDEAHKKIEPQPQPQQEKAMPTVIDDGRIVNNVSRTVFNFIHGNPGIKRQDARQRLVAQGFKDSSVTSLTSQMIRTNMIRVDENDSLFTMRQEYAPVQSKKHKPKRKVVVISRPRPTPVVEPQVSPAPVLLKGVTPIPEVRTKWDAATALANLSVKDAHALWVELNKMFGGK